MIVVPSTRSSYTPVISNVSACVSHGVGRLDGNLTVKKIKDFQPPCRLRLSTPWNVPSGGPDPANVNSCQQTIDRR